MTSPYAKVTRQMVTEIKEGLEKLEKRFDEFDRRTTKMFNHLSNRLPPWAVAVGFVLVSLLSGITGVFLSKIL